MSKKLVRSDFYQHPDLYDAPLPVSAHLPFYAELALDHGRAGVLELACGTGNSPCLSPVRESKTPFGAGSPQQVCVCQAAA